MKALQAAPAAPLIARFNNGFVAENYTVNSMKLYISPGMGARGWLFVPYGVPSESTWYVLLAR